MALVLASPNFNRGYVSDISLDQLPPDAAYRMKDWIPQLGAPLRRRGGWTYTSPDLNALHATLYLTGMAWAPFKDDEHLVIIGEGSGVYFDRTFDGATATYVANVPASPTHQPIWHQDLKALILLGPYPTVARSTTAPYKYYHVSGSGLTSVYGVAALGGTPPSSYAGASWGDYLLLVGDTGKTNRIFVSGVGNAESWATGTDFWDSVIPTVIGIVPVRAGILVFGYSQTSLISGDIPPAGGNWSEQIIFKDVGCFDVRSIARYGDSVIFANDTGVYMTDGITFRDLTALAGVKQNWRLLAAGFNYAGGWSAAGGVFRDKYIISIYNNSNVITTCHVFDLSRGIAYEFTNVGAQMFAHRLSDEGTANLSGQEMLFMASRGSTHVEGLHPAWNSPDTPTDGDGTAVLPSLTTPFYKPGGPGRKRIRSVRATYDVRAQGGNSPILRVNYFTVPDQSPSTLAGDLPTTTDVDRERVDIRAQALGVGLQFTQIGQSSHTSLGEIELDLNVLEGMR